MDNLWTSPHSTLGVWIPTKVLKCRRCGGRMRGTITGAETLIICDDCEYFTNAPADIGQYVQDLIGADIMLLRRN